jgi:hypothetical protein
MMKYLTIMLLLMLTPAGVAESKGLQWKKYGDHVEFIANGSYTTNRGAVIKFAAVRFHLGFTRLRIIDTAQAVNANRDVHGGVARSVVDGNYVG